MTSKLKEIGYFRTTDREPNEIMQFCDVDETELKNLPNNSKILVVGSGLRQSFSRYIRELRPDIQTVSIDPTVVLGSRSDFDSFTERNSQGQLKTVQYTPKRDFSLAEDSEETKKVTYDERIDHAFESGNVISALAPTLPFADNTFNLLIDSFGPGMYLNEDEVEIYISNIARVINENGMAIIFPINPYNNVLNDILDVQTRNLEDRNTWESILKEIQGINYEFYEIEEDREIDVTNPNVGDGKEKEKRVGVKISKRDNSESP